VCIAVCIVVVCMVLTVVSGDNWLLCQIQGSIADRLEFGNVYINLNKCLKSTSSRVGLDEVGFDINTGGSDILSEIV
jgi:hypothetical protein